MMTRSSKLTAFLTTLLLMVAVTVFGQEREIVQLSGVVISAETKAGIPGVHIYVPRSGRGTVSSPTGYFSLPLLVGDSLLISSVGFQRQAYLIPGDRGGSITHVFELEIDTTYLDNVDIFPYPTEEALKEAILALKIEDETEQLRERLDGQYIAYLAMTTPYDGSLNARYYFDQQANYEFNRYGPAYNPFLNPFNWARFIESLRRDRDRNRR